IQLANLVVANTFLKPRIPPRKNSPLVDWQAFRELEYTLVVGGHRQCRKHGNMVNCAVRSVDAICRKLGSSAGAEAGKISRSEGPPSLQHTPFRLRAALMKPSPSTEKEIS